MTYTNRKGPRRVDNWTLLISVLAIGFACSSDQESLLLVNVPPASLPPTASSISFSILVGSEQVAQETRAVAENAEGKFGFYLSSSVSGSATVAIAVYDASACLVATGTGGPVNVSPGKKSDPIVVSVALATAPCGVDGGMSDAPGPTGIDGGPIDAAGGETSIDGGPTGIDGPSLDAGAGNDDDAHPDVRDDDAADASIVADRPMDLPPTDAPLQTDVEVDGGPGTVDAPPTTASVFRNCTKYTHTVIFSSGTIGDWGVLKVLFTPDGKNLVSMGEDGRAKVWDVTPTGLVPNASDLLFTGDSELTGTIRSDGKYLAIGERYGKVTIYDLPASISAGAAVEQWTLPATDFTDKPWRALPRHFTSDGTHLVVAYSAGSSPEPNLVVVWDVTSQQIVRSVPFDYDDWPMAALPGSYLDPLWVASAMETHGDGGYETVVSLMDIGLANPNKTQITLGGTVNAMTFTPDGTGLAIGMASGEVGIYDISDRSKIVPPSVPLVPEVSAFYTDVYSLAFTSDGRYLGVGGENNSGTAVKLVSLADAQVTEKSVDYSPITLAFAPDNLGLAFGEYHFGVVVYCTP